METSNLYSIFKKHPKLLGIINPYGLSKAHVCEYDTEKSSLFLSRQVIMAGSAQRRLKKWENRHFGTLFDLCGNPACPGL